jgi:hypothetical protein
MSHISRIKTRMVEKNYILTALQDLGYSVEEGDFKIKAFGGDEIKVEMKVNLKMSNDIGFRKNGDHFEVIADWWGVRSIKKDAFVKQLTQRYAYHATKAKLEQQGFALVEEETKETGQIHLVLRRMV